MPGTGEPGSGKNAAAQRCMVSMNRAGSWDRMRARFSGLRRMTSAHSGRSATASIPPVFAARAEPWQ